MTRTFRPQFTLRLLLLAMALFGISLGVWRWPWVEELCPYDTNRVYPPGFDVGNDIPTIVTARIPYHRGWTGKPLKHGLLEAYYSDGRLLLKQPWRDGSLHGVERWYDSQGINIEQTWNNGERDGPFRYRNREDWTGEGKFVDGVAYCERRQMELWASGERIWNITTWVDDKRQGPARWETTSGEVLQTGEYDVLRLVHWNGEPVVDYLSDWIATGRIDDPQTIQVLQRGGNLSVLVDYSLLRFTSQRRGIGEHQAIINSSTELVSRVLAYGLAPDVRYGRIWYVPADEVGNWQDSTGVSELDVSPFPKLAEAWNRPIQRHTVNLNYARLDELLEVWPGHTEVFLDYARHFPEESKRIANDPKGNGVDQNGGYSPQDIRPTLKNYLGLRLYLAGLQCELQGNKIVILPHWTKRRD